MDISATILDRVGIEPYNGMQGRSLLPVINKELGHHRESLLIEEVGQKALFGSPKHTAIGPLHIHMTHFRIYAVSGNHDRFKLTPHTTALLPHRTVRK